MKRFIFGSAVLAVFAVSASAGTVLIDFENVPPEATGPSVFTNGAPSQTVTVPGVATVTGGVILGNETFLPSQAFGTAPNVYATSGFDTALPSALQIAIDPSFLVDEVSFPLFNGSTQPESYVVDIFDGVTNVGSQTLTNLASNGDSGFGIIDLTAANITSVTIAPVALDAGCCGGWDYSIDSVALNESVEAAFAPEPGTMALLGLSLIGLASIPRKRR